MPMLDTNEVMEHSWVLQNADTMNTGQGLVYWHTFVTVVMMTVPAVLWRAYPLLHLILLVDNSSLAAQSLLDICVCSDADGLQDTLKW